MTGATRPLPSWVLNLLGFGMLIALVLAVFFWQLLDIDRELQRNTQARSATMAAIIEENLTNAELSTTTSFQSPALGLPMRTPRLEAGTVRSG